MNLAIAPHSWRIGLIGYGEAGRILAETLRGKDVADVIAFGIKLGTAAEGPLREHAERHSSLTRGA